MKRRLFPALAVLALGILSSCGGTKSSQQTMAEDRDYMYKESYKAYSEAEDKYLNLLFNIERMPEEEELWMMKRDQMKELEQLRALMLQSRGELDESLQEWERYLSELQKETIQANAQSRAHFRSQDDRRSSPGELLPGEFAQDSIRKAQREMKK